jgi:mRNA interferase HicA
VKRVDLVRHLEGHGCLLLREGGSHSVYVNRAARKTSTVPRHREIKDCSLRSLLFDSLSAQLWRQTSPSIMTDREALVAHYVPLLTAELQRIGFTDDDLRYLGSGGELSQARFEAELAELRGIPSGIGAEAYFARVGVDFAAIKREVTSRDGAGPSTDESRLTKQ